MNQIVQSIGLAHEKRKLDPFEVGDLVEVHVNITEGEKSRTQVFAGMVIAMKGIKHRDGEMRGAICAAFTVRRVVQNTMGVERVFPLHCPAIEKVVVRCIEEGLVSGQRFAVDASLIEADANRQNSSP